MKKNLLPYFFMLINLLAIGQIEINHQWKNQINPIFQGLNKNNIPHAILLDYAMEFTNVKAYNGTLTDSTSINTSVLGNIYKTLFMGKTSTDTSYFPKMEIFAKNWTSQRYTKNQTVKNTIVLAGLFYNYFYITNNALQQINLA